MNCQLHLTAPSEILLTAFDRKLKLELKCPKPHTTRGTSVWNPGFLISSPHSALTSEYLVFRGAEVFLTPYHYSRYETSLPNEWEQNMEQAKESKKGFYTTVHSIHPPRCTPYRYFLMPPRCPGPP